MRSVDESLCIDMRYQKDSGAKDCLSLMNVVVIVMRSCMYCPVAVIVVCSF